MIKISGTINRTFIFPAPIQETLTYFSELTKVVRFMPHIQLVHEYALNQIRVLYETVELGVYNFRIFSDLEGSIDRKQHTISVVPVRIPTAVPINSSSTARETTGHGLFAIQAQLFDLQTQTRLEATLRLQASLERPRAMSLMPHRVVNRLAQSIADHRIKEMSDGFIRTAVENFSHASQQP